MSSAQVSQKSSGMPSGVTSRLGLSIFQPASLPSLKTTASSAKQCCWWPTSSVMVAAQVRQQRHPRLLRAARSIQRHRSWIADSRDQSTLGMPPGIGIEFYAQPLEDGDWDTWIGAGGQGNGFNFPTSIAVTLEYAREAFDDYVGDHYRDLKFDKDWYPPEDRRSEQEAECRHERNRAIDSDSRLRRPIFAQSCLRDGERRGRFATSGSLAD